MAKDTSGNVIETALAAIVYAMVVQRQVHVSTQPQSPVKQRISSRIRILSRRRIVSIVLRI
jgi:hypothetical protein